VSITVQVKNVYGNELIYPVCEQARLFADIAGTKTLSRTVVSQIKRLGYTIQVEQRSL
jgi:hypothetical protein